MLSDRPQAPQIVMGVILVLTLGFFLVQTSAQEAVSQEDLDYMGDHLHVEYRVLDNFQDTLRTFRCQISLTNAGARAVPGAGWRLFWAQLNLLEPDHHPYPQGHVLDEYHVRVRHVQGGVFSLEPAAGWGRMAPGETRVIRFLSENFSVARTDGYPNWYVWAPGLSARTLATTAGEDLDWVGNFDQENTWKRYSYSTPEASDRDRYDPYTAQARFAVNAVKDLGGPGKLVIPTPAKLSVKSPHKLRLDTKDWTIVCPDIFRGEAQHLGELLAMPVIRDEEPKPQSHVIAFRRADVRADVGGREVGGPEAYSLSVDAQLRVITIRAREPAGAFRAAMTLTNLLDDDNTVPEVSIVDAPRYAYRGLMLDVARNFHPLDDVLRLLDLMARYKLNMLHLHLTDDEGWRLEIPGLEELTAVGGRRCHDVEETSCILPYLGSGPAPAGRGSGFYTLDDYRQILRHAQARHIQVIPEVDLPGHGHAAIRAMEARRRRLMRAGNATEAERFVLVEQDDPSVYKSVQLFNDNAVNPCLPSTYAFIEAVVRTLVAAHRDVQPLETFHFGGDEVAKGAWVNSSACKSLVASDAFIGYTDLKEYFVRQVSNVTRAYSLGLAAWEDGVMAGGSTPYARSKLANAQVSAYAWDNIWEWGVANRAYKLANAGYKVVMAQATHLYFDHPYEPDPEERGLYWAPRFTDTRKTFGFMPGDLYANAKLARNGAPVQREDLCGEDGEQCVPLQKPDNIAGIQGHLWSEVIRTRDQADYMLWPRVLALAERAWHEAEWERLGDDHVAREAGADEDWARFASTLGYRELARLDRLGVTYRVPPPGARVVNGRLVTNVAYPGLTVEGSTDGGRTWCDVRGGLARGNGTQIILRTRSAGGGRHSRHVKVRLDAGSSGAPRPLASLWLLVLSSHLTFCFVKKLKGQ